MSNPTAKRASSAGPKSAGSKSLNDFQLGDSLGKGAFGQVYRALKWATGETVAVKEIQLSNIPKAELGEIMSEIDLLKNLNHPNIVKYKGFVKTAEFLYIILEFCENGSLHNICKRFGKFPETLVAVYISQVLEGLVYLHDQGVIHRDIKGANILTNKDGCVKLADFGVASSTTTGAVSNDAVVGSPYWMAPEVIEQSGATTASDIWSVGCVVIELLEGRPPYHNLDPMPALFRIVQDDCPPIPEGASPIVKDFLYHCFQKDVNLRISARKLLRHPWMVSARKQMSDDTTITSSDGGLKANGSTDRRPLSNYNYDEAVLKVQEWNEALKSPSRPSKNPSRNKGKGSLIHPDSPTRPPSDAFGHLPLSALPLSASHGSASSAGASRKLSNASMKPPGIDLVQKIQPLSFALQAPEEQTDNWDDDFEGGISFRKLPLNKSESGKSEKDNSRHGRSSQDDKSSSEPEDPGTDDNARTIKPNKSPGAHLRPLAKPPATEIDSIVEDYSDLAFDEDEDTLQDKLNDFKMKNSLRRGLFHPDDIKLFAGTNVSPGPSTAPLPEIGSHKPRRPSLGPLITGASHSGPQSASSTSGGWHHSHLRSSSSTVFNNGGANSNGTNSAAGSWGQADAQKMQSEFGKYTEDDDEDYEDVFGKVNGAASEQPISTLQLNTRLSNKSWLGDELSDEEDPFAEIDEGFSEEDLEANLQRDKYARLTNSVNQLIDELTPSAPNFQLRDACDQLLAIMTDTPEMHGQLVSSHGMLAILEVLEGNCSRDVTERLLQIINLLVNSHVGFLESFCLIGGIPVMMKFTSKRHPSECRLQASNFIRLLCHTSVLTLQMFISCRGLRVLVELLDEDYTDQAELVVHALNGITSVFDLQSPTTKNDFCRMFIREGLLNPLSSALLNVMSSSGSPSSTDMKMKIIQIFLVFAQVSQNDIHIRNALGTRQVIRRLLRACELLEPDCLVHLLRAVKHLSMNSTLLDVLQNANAIEILVRILDESSSGPHGTEISNHIIQTCYNLCKLNKLRQEEAAQAGIIACLKRVVQTSSPLRQFALPILCDLASAGKSCRTLLWQHDGLGMYLGLLQDPYFQVSALESILSWLQEETSRVEDELLKPTSVDALLKCFVSSKANSFENLVDPLLKIIRTSTPVTIAISSKSQFFKRLLDRLSNHGKAVVRLNLLRILKGVCDIHPNKAILVDKYGLGAVVEKLSREDGAVLVRELAREIAPTLGNALRSRPKPRNETPGKVFIAPKKMRRTASESTPSALHTRSNTRVDLSSLPMGGSPFSPPVGTPASSMRRSSNSSGTSGRTSRPRQKLDGIPWVNATPSLRR